MNIKKIIREEIKKLDESVESDLVLPKGKKVVLRADNPEVNRGLIVTWLEKGGYNVEYWYKDPSKIYPAEVKIDGESITKDGKIVYVGYHPKLDETISVNEATVTFRGARGRSVVVPNEYVSKLGRVEHKLMKMLGYILDYDTASGYYMCVSDLNQDDIINVQDIVLMINIILSE